MSALNPKIGYRPDIDGLRAIAVLFVVGFHAFPQALQGGFIGVDLFFVISGFLISQIIFGHVRAGDFSFLDFYRRRVRRIFPALLIVLIFSLIVGWFFLLSTEYGNLGHHVLGAVLFVSNIFLYNETGYFDEAAYTKPLLHLWSLGIEEQFYLVWPVLILLSWRFLKEKTIHVLMIVTIISFMANVAFIKPYPNWSFFLPFTRMWELAIGSILAWYHIFPVQGYFKNIFTKNANALGVVGLAMIIGSAFCANQIAVILWVPALAPIVGMCLLIMGSERSWVQRHILSRPALVSIGLISYPLYLWHWPLLSFGRIIENGPIDMIGKITLLLMMFVLAWGTYQFIEKPIRFGRKVHTVTLVVAMIAVGIMGLLVSKNHGVPSRSLGGLYGKNLNDAVNDWGFPGTLIKKDAQGMRYYVTSDNVSPTTVFFGDSHVEQLGPRIEHVAKTQKINPVAVVVNPGCPGGLDVEADDLKCANVIADFQTFLKQTPSIKNVVIGGCWNCAFDTAPDREHIRYIQDGQRRIDLSTEEGRNLSLKSLKAFLQTLSGTYQTYLLLDNPSSMSFRPNNILGKRWSLYADTTQNLQVDFPVDPFQIDLNTRLKQMMAGSNIRVIDQIEHVCPHNQCRALDADLRPIYKDANHMRPFFVIDQATYLDPVFE